MFAVVAVLCVCACCCCCRPSPCHTQWRSCLCLCSPSPGAENAGINWGINWGNLVTHLHPPAHTCTTTTMSSLKLGALLVKTLSKPLAKSIKQQAAVGLAGAAQCVAGGGRVTSCSHTSRTINPEQEHPRFKGICISIAQNYHRLQHSLSRK